MTQQIKVVAINGSPHGVNGNTGQMIEMLSSHLSMEEITLNSKRIEYCSGCALP
jgi:multimeric flavodoxin WrbA